MQSGVPLLVAPYCHAISIKVLMPSRKYEVHTEVCAKDARVVTGVGDAYLGPILYKGVWWRVFKWE